MAQLASASDCYPVHLDEIRRFVDSPRGGGSSFFCILYVWFFVALFPSQGTARALLGMWIRTNVTLFHLYIQVQPVLTFSFWEKI